MSQENVEVVRASMDAFLAVEFERALSYYCEDVVFQPLVGGPYHGRSGVAQQMQTWVDEFNDYWFEVDELIDAEDQVVLLWRDGGVGKSSGVRVEQEAATIYTVDDGCISHARVYADRARALEAAGLREQTPGLLLSRPPRPYSGNFERPRRPSAALLLVAFREVPKGF